MKVFFLRLLVIVVILFLQLSFLDILIPQVSAPILIFIAAIAWTLISGFPEVFSWTIPLVILFEAVSSGTIGSVSLYAVPLMYCTSFLSRRLLIQHRGTGIFLYALFACGGVLGYQGIFFTIKNGSFFSGVRELFFSGTAALSFFLGMFLFIVTYAFLARFETYLKQIAQNEFRNVR